MTYSIRCQPYKHPTVAMQNTISRFFSNPSYAKLKHPSSPNRPRPLNNRLMYWNWSLRNSRGEFLYASRGLAWLRGFASCDTSCSLTAKLYEFFWLFSRWQPIRDLIVRRKAACGVQFKALGCFQIPRLVSEKVMHCSGFLHESRRREKSRPALLRPYVQTSHYNLTSAKVRSQTPQARLNLQKQPAFDGPQRIRPTNLLFRNLPSWPVSRNASTPN